jgi:hypothetical protein
MISALGLFTRYRLAAAATVALAALLSGPVASAAAVTPQSANQSVAAVSEMKKVVPKVVGKTAYAAKNALKKGGLGYRYITPKGSFVVLSKNWTVTKQSPKAKSKVKAGTKVKLTVVKTDALKPATSSASPYGAYPPDEAQFVKIISDTETQLKASPTSLQQSQLISNRDTQLCAVVPGNQMNGWVGTIHNIGANGDGYAYVEIEIAPTVVVQTWNNDFSDANDSTLIKPDESFFSTLVPMKEGSKVEFSGALLGSSSSCLEKANLTQLFYGLDPNFIARFSDIATQ